MQSGIDISVPSHEPAAVPKLVKFYHVIVITTLPHFKTAVHSEDSVVQFMVSNSYTLAGFATSVQAYKS